jgi:hypothetical protein
MAFLKLTSFVKNDDYKSLDTGLILKDQFEEIPVIINTDDITQVFVSKSGVGATMVKFRTGLILDFKNSMDEFTALLVKEGSNLTA